MATVTKTLFATGHVSASAHSREPWVVKQETAYVPAQVWTEDGRQLAEVYGETRVARVANAHLMAAAPDLLRALRVACDALEQWMKFVEDPDGVARKGWQWVFDDAAAAIAKAEASST